GRAVALDYHDAAGAHTIAVEGEIILSAGAVNSPQLLLLSGIGPADELHAHGIAVVSDRRGVGRNLHNHPVLALQYVLAEPLSAPSYLKPLRAVQAGLRYALWRDGPLAESYVATGGMLRTDPSLAIADIIVVMVPALTFRGGVGATLRELLPQRHGFVV